MAANEGSQLQGIGRSPGVAVGRAYTVVGEIDIQALSSEDILVCVSDNPYRVGWLALYLVVRGIVVTKRSGAGLHHALQLAREVGVPYVELAPGEAERIPAGAEIRIDGTTGSIGIVGSAG